MSLPLIGITTSTRLSEGPLKLDIPDSYAEAVAAAGAAPVLIPQGPDEADLQRLVSRLDGVLFSGGGDIEPWRFNGRDHPSLGWVNPDRDRVELFLFQEILKRKKPFLGICRGIQLVNVACGGSLYVDVPSHLPGAIPHDFHDNPARDYPAHVVRLEENCRLAQILGTAEPAVNSLHHQGIERLGAGLHACGWTSDDLAEAVEMTGYSFGLAVQWHPECMPQSEPMRMLFKAFVEAASQPSH